MKHKPFYILPFLVFFTGFSAAQETSLTVEKDSIVLTDIEKHSALLEAFISYQKGRGDYRIQIYSGPLDQTEELLKNLDESFSEWPRSIDFESPSFRLRIGTFKTRLEAERNLIAVRKKYPAAVLLKPQILKNN
ncbi:SPOR domain-containing protein [Flavobacteriaceae bacterium]|nr:SPOR domain-containing protein [Flavobacteriaceae bacterium]